MVVRGKSKLSHVVHVNKRPLFIHFPEVGQKSVQPPIRTKNPVIYPIAIELRPKKTHYSDIRNQDPPPTSSAFYTEDLRCAFSPSDFGASTFVPRAAYAVFPSLSHYVQVFVYIDPSQ